MISIRMEKQSNKKLLSQLSESDADFMIGQSNHTAEAESRENMTSRGNILNNTNDTTQVNYPQVDMHILEKNIVSKVRSEVDNVMTTLETTVQDTILTAIESLMIRSVELAMKSTNASSGRSVDDNVLEPDQKDFLVNIEGLQMTASSRINSHTDLNRINETRGNITVEESDLLVNDRNIDRQTHTHYSCNLSALHGHQKLHLPIIPQSILPIAVIGKLAQTMAFSKNECNRRIVFVSSDWQLELARF